MGFSATRLVDLTSTTAQVLFNADIDTDVGIANVSITSQIDSVPDSTVTAVMVEDNIIYLTFKPIFPNIQYKITFTSTDTVSFQNTSEEVISEIGNDNYIFIVYAGEEEGTILESMLDGLTPTVYEVEESTLVKSLMASMANELTKTH